MKTLAPTKTNLLKIKDELKFAQLGHELLDQKRNILVVELLTLVDQAAEYEQKVQDALTQAYSALGESAMAMGKLKVSAVASAINVEPKINIKQRRVMGVALPVVETSFVDHAPYYSPTGTSFWLDRSVKEFQEALKLMGRFAELKASIMRLATEVRKTMRKVNALEKIAIPDLAESVHYIQNRLEENERDMFTLMKLVKNRMTDEKTEAPKS
jgi:V/A-type H+/Na+-transporting ATPase subunit D